MKRTTAIAMLLASTLSGAAAAAVTSSRAPHTAPGVDPLVALEALVETGRPLWSPPEPALGDRLGTFRLTYYYLPTEPDGPQTVKLFSKQCRPLARVTPTFSRQLAMQGGGKLSDGRVLVFAGKCRCSSAPCYKVARRDHDWGTGAGGGALAPFRSIAVDPSLVSIGKVLYVPELDGLTMPGSPPWGGFVHDGCVLADDRGGGIRGRQIDFFAARKSHYTALDRRHHLKKVTVFEGGERCRALGRRRPSRRGSI